MHVPAACLTIIWKWKLCLRQTAIYMRPFLQKSCRRASIYRVGQKWNILTAAPSVVDIWKPWWPCSTTNHLHSATKPAAHHRCGHRLVLGAPIYVFFFFALLFWPEKSTTLVWAFFPSICRQVVRFDQRRHHQLPAWGCLAMIMPGTCCHCLRNCSHHTKS